MFSEVQRDGSVDDSGQLATEREGRIDRMLAALCDGRLAGRIMDVARLAVVKHTVEPTQCERSAVEAENSTE